MDSEGKKKKKRKEERMSWIPTTLLPQCQPYNESFRCDLQESAAQSAMTLPPPSLFDQQTRYPPALSLESPPTSGPAHLLIPGFTTARLIPSKVPPKVLAALYHFHPHLP